MAQDSDVALAQTVEMYQKGDRDKALRMLAEAAMAFPDNIRIPLTLAKLLVREQRQEEAHRLLSSLPEDKRAIAEIRDLLAHIGFMLAASNAPSKRHLEALVSKEVENLEARYKLCALKLIDDDYEGAMELLLEIMRRDSRFRNGAGRNGLLALFNLLGNEGELVDRYRKLMVQYLH